MSRRVALWGAGIIALGAAAAATRVRSYDFFWHLAAGRWIREHGAVPRTDPFSFTAVGAPWVDHGWLFQVVLERLWEVGGLAAAWGAKVAIGAALAWVIASHLRRRGVEPPEATLLVLAALAGAAPRIGDRPEALTLLFVVLTARFLSGRACLLVVPLAALWINVHAGAILAPVLSAAALVGEAAEGAWRRRVDRRRLVVLAATAAGSGAALLLNPYGAAAVLVPFRLTRLVGESWVPNPEWIRPTPTLVPGLFLGIAALLLAALIHRRQARGLPLALGVVGTALALQYVRNVGVFFVLLPFALEPFVARRRWLPAWSTPALIAVGLSGLLLAPGQGVVGPGLEPGRYPVQACDYLDGEGLDGRVFNEVAFGGYLIWRFPGRPVFIDGRNEIYPELLRTLFEAFERPPVFWELMRRWEVEVALLRYPPAPQAVRYPGPPATTRLRSWSEVFFPSTEWALVHWDDTAMVRVRRSTVKADWLTPRDLALNPDDWPFVRERVLAGEIEAGPLLQEVEAVLVRDPGSARARWLVQELRGLHPAAGR